VWSAIKKLLGGEPAAQGGDAGLDEARVCATALLVEIALSDGVYASVEAEQISEIIRSSFGIEGEDAKRILHAAEMRAEEATDHHQFTKSVKGLPLAEREGLVESLWRVVFADGEESPEEEAMVRRLADLLHVDPRASRLARLRVAGESPHTE
jgi:uncharacterized tellurite resistance protein B-like protein